MKTTNKWLYAASSTVMACIFIVACNKENSGSTAIPTGKSQFSVYMMDDPVPFTKVLIDIKQVVVKIDTAAHHDDTDDDHEWKEDYRGCRNGNSVICTKRNPHFQYFSIGNKT